MATVSKAEYKTEPLKTYAMVKDFRDKYYRDAYEAKKNGGILVSGTDASWFVFCAGLGKDVYTLTGEPYGASTGFHADFGIKCQEAADQAGVPRDLCSYMRAYWGSIILDKYLLADGTVLDHWPKSDFMFSSHGCCNHAKWFQRASELEGGTPFLGFDHTSGPGGEITPSRIQYYLAQYMEAIELMEKITGREYNDELMVDAMNNECRSRTAFAEACMYTQTVPSPVNERRLYNFYVVGALCPESAEAVKIQREFRDELKDRVARGIAGVATEKFRFMTEQQPPWPFLNFYKNLEAEYGAVSVGSEYVQGIGGNWMWREDGHKFPAKLPEEIGLAISTENSREENVRRYIEYRMIERGGRGDNARAHNKEHRRQRNIALSQDWHLQAAISHLTRGCLMLNLRGPERQQEARDETGLPRIEIEGSQADPREFDVARETARVVAFLEGLGCTKLAS